MTTFLLTALVVVFVVVELGLRRARAVAEGVHARLAQALPLDDRPPAALAPADVEGYAARGLAEIEALLRRTRGDLSA